MTEQKNAAMGFLIIEEAPQTVAKSQLPPWNILVVDDDEQVQAVTKMVLRHVQFRDRPFKLISARSGKEARDILRDTPEGFALALVDVVMETKTAGLDLVRHIRDDLKDRSIRLIMRTGQPGHAPEQNVVIDYEIDAYMAKTDISAQKLVTAIIASLRAYEYISEIKTLNAELEARVAMRTAELEKLAMLDALTGAGNRRHLEQRAEAEISACQRAQQIAERIRSAIAAQNIAANGNIIHITASFGLAALGPDLSLENALARADNALYRAKKGGRNQIALDDIS
ncbi:MAG: diguanylate cyclase [Burkholderiales bacterium]|nr:diguanylate cyclase [Burkholderiales bacterium]